MDINSKIDKYLSLEEEIKEYFKYEEQWRAVPLSDMREYWWRISGNEVWYWKEEPKDVEEAEYSSEIRGVYVSEVLTAVVEDTNCDFNVFLSIFNNSKRVPD